MKLHPDAPEMTWQEARVVMGIIASMVAMGEAADAAATHAAEESGAVVEVPNMMPGRLHVHVYRRIFPGGIRVCWLIEHAKGDRADADRIHEHLVAHHACYLSPREAARIARSGGNVEELPCGCSAWSPISRSVRVHKRIRNGPLVIRDEPVDCGRVGVV